MRRVESEKLTMNSYVERPWQDLLIYLAIALIIALLVLCTILIDYCLLIYSILFIVSRAALHQ